MITSLLSLTVAAAAVITNTNIADKNDISNVSYTAKTEDFTSLSWHNDNKLFDEKTKSFFIM